ncbi:MAG: hypothetical protein ABI875_01925 [Gemmatimonadales bacterium]
MKSRQKSGRDLARSLPLTAFAALNAIGVIAASAIVLFRPHWWAMGLFTIAVAAAALWGIAERALTDLEFRGSPSGAREYGPYAVLGEVARIVAIITAVMFALLGPGVWIFGQIGVGGG